MVLYIAQVSMPDAAALREFERRDVARLCRLPGNVCGQRTHLAWARFGAPRMGQIWPNSARFEPSLGELGSSLVDLGPNLAGFAPNVVDLVRILPTPKSGLICGLLASLPGAVLDRPSQELPAWLMWTRVAHLSNLRALRPFAIPLSRRQCALAWPFCCVATEAFWASVFAPLLEWHATITLPL